MIADFRSSLFPLDVAEFRDPVPSLPAATACRELQARKFLDDSRGALCCRG
jgi:hypothetical protein